MGVLFLGLCLLSSCIGGYWVLVPQPPDGDDSGAPLETADTAAPAACADSELIEGNLDWSGEGQSICGDAPITLDGDLLVWSDADDLSGLACLCRVNGDVVFIGNTRLTALSGLDGLTSVGGDLLLLGNLLLQDLSALSNLTAIEGALHLERNGLLLRVAGLESLARTGGLLIVDNNSLSTLSGFAGLVDIDGALFVRGNNQLGSLAGLESLTGLAGPLRVETSALTSLTGLESLTAVSEGSLRLDENQRLTSLAGLEGLGDIGEDLSLRRNPALVDISALHAVRSVGVNFTVTDNRELSTDAVYALLDAIGEENIGSTITISGNAP